MKKIITHFTLVFITTLLILNPEKSIQYAKDGLIMCQEIIIPSLFPFFVCSGLLVYSGFCEILAKLFKPVMKPLFNINPTGAAAFILGIISGYPLGAVTTCQLYNNLYISKSEAERLLAFCNNSGPLFILGAVGISMYHSPKAGIILYIAHILGAISVGIIFRFYKSKTFSAPQQSITTNKKSIPELFQIVLSNSVQSILTVCGAVIFCSVAANLIINLFSLNALFDALLKSSMEFVSGLWNISYLDIPLFSKLILSSAVCAFAGISVHLQVMSVVSDTGLSLTPYIIGKLIHAAFSVIYTFILLKVFPVTQNIYTLAINSQKFSAGFFICSIYTLLSVLLIVSLLILNAPVYKKKKKKNNFISF